MLASIPAVARVPSLLFVNGGQRETIELVANPFTIGRRIGNHVVIADPSVSRDHAQLVQENGEWFLIDRESKHGTFVNNAAITRYKLQPGDRITFARATAAYLVFDGADSGSGRNWISELSVLRPPSGVVGELEQLKAFLEVVRRFDATQAIDEIFVTLINFALQVTKAERGYLYINEDQGLRLAYGRDKEGRALTEDRSISHSVLREAAQAKAEFIIKDTQLDSALKSRDSIVMHNLRSIVCLPLHRRGQDNGVAGVLYLDSHGLTTSFTDLSHDILRALATDAAGILENIRLAEADERARRYEQELQIAGQIQQQLLSVRMPNCPFASAQAVSVACKQVGGDFYDIIATADALYFVFADVSGKGIYAALLASVLQGVTYSHFTQSRPLLETVTAANTLLCEKHLDGKYATLVAGRLGVDGKLSIVNCGHVAPLRVRDGVATEIDCSNLPIGLFPGAQFEVYETQLAPDERVIIVSDGVTEAEDASTEFFGDDRLRNTIANGCPQDVLAAVREHCGDKPMADDCSILEIRYKGAMSDVGDATLM